MTLKNSLAYAKGQLITENAAKSAVEGQLAGERKKSAGLETSKAAIEVKLVKEKTKTSRLEKFNEAIDAELY